MFVSSFLPSVVSCFLQRPFFAKHGVRYQKADSAVAIANGMLFQDCRLNTLQRVDLVS